VYAPSFDHAVQDPVENDIVVSSRSRIVIIEGNYTLLDQKPWNEIPYLCDERLLRLTVLNGNRLTKPGGLSTLLPMS